MNKCIICENHQRTGKKHTCSKCETKIIRRNAAIIDGWVRLYICITTNDINEFYKALRGNEKKKGAKNYHLWEMVNKPYERNRK